MTFGNNMKEALFSLKTSRWRSMLTVLGIIIGVASVVTIVSIGEGVRKQVEGQINILGSDTITVRPGKSVTRNSEGKIIDVNFLASQSNGSFSNNDYEVISKSKNVLVSVPFSKISAVAKTDEREFLDGNVVATTSELPKVLKQKVLYGEFFDDKNPNKNIAILGKIVAQELFNENVPIGKSLQIRGEQFIVGGIMDNYANNPLSPSTDYNRTIFIPYETGKKISGGQTQIYQVMVVPEAIGLTDEVAKNITINLQNAHGNQEDFTVLKKEDTLAVTNGILKLLTSLIAGLAGISLIVGGIGIMNIMLLSVTERTREIGVRKAVGATNRQILNQFLTEAAILSLAGGFLGIIVSLVVDYAIALFTDIVPAITFPIMGIALVLALAVGVFFGITPALKAASKDPIDALRYE